MGAKPSNNLKSDRPESGGADKDMAREKSGLLDRDKEKFAVEQQKKFADEQARQREAADDTAPTWPNDFSVGSPRNPDPHSK
ncbi:MAG: hypothetical protein ACJ8AD_16515 [Gemmatimonadaceae bacterium]